MAEPSDATGLVPTLRVRVAGDTVSFDLSVANGGDAPVTLTFATSQRYDFVVVDESGAEVWRWSADRMFGQALSEVALPVRGVLAYHGSWYPKTRGRFRAVARLMSTNHPIRIEAEFEEPAE
jgi:hypothetical protein